jgi:serine/threonine protein kinase/Tfp pilus assembly protein PilF
MKQQTRPLEPPVEFCATCGRPLTPQGQHGECLRCLVNVGLFATADPTSARPASRRRPTPGPLRYAHFEIDVGGDGFPVELGAGAMAVTYRARDTVLNSAVALKVIDCTIAANPAARTRFLREARAAAQLHHPNVARVTHYGEQDGECFYVMELVEGETLEARVRREGPMSLAPALQVMEQAARALAAAEAHGIVHRDIKPSNVMMESEASGSMLVKVIDYGIAKTKNPRAEPGSHQTQAGFVGTPAFASPEQFAGSLQTAIDTRSDIYSLGVTLWYLLTGRTPFVGRTLDEVRMRQTRELPLEQLRDADVPAQVLALLKSMLAVDPAERPQSARELLAAVHRCYVRFEPQARRRRKRLLVASSIAALVLAAALVGTWFYQQARSDAQAAQSIAVLPFESVSPGPEDQLFADAIQDEIRTKLASLADLKVISRTSTQQYKSKPADLATVGRQLRVGRVLQGSVHRIADTVRVQVQLIDPRSNTHLWGHTYDHKLDDAFTVQSAVANAVAQQLNTKFAQTISTERPSANPAAYNAYLRGLGIEYGQSGASSYQNAAAAYSEAVQLDPNFALAWARLSLARSFLLFNGTDRNVNSPTAVKEAADRAIALGPNLGESWLAQGSYRSRVLRDVAGALQAYGEAEKYLPNSSLVHELIVYAACRLGRWREAEAHFWRATELDPLNFRLWSTTADQLFIRMRRWSEAEAAIDRALEISPNNEEAIAHKADLFQTAGRLDEAAEELARLPRNSDNLWILALRAQQAVLERKFDEAIFWSQQQTKDWTPGEPLNAENAEAVVLQGYCHEWAGRADQARITFQRVLEALAPTPGFVIAPGRELRSYLALAYAGLADKDKALEQAHQAVADFAHDAVIKPIAERYLVQIQMRFGDVDSAIAGITHLLAVPRGLHPAELRYSALWDPLRKDPRFEALVEHPPAVRF